jgi:hypothetical protein
MATRGRKKVVMGSKLATMGVNIAAVSKVENYSLKFASIEYPSFHTRAEHIPASGKAVLRLTGVHQWSSTISHTMSGRQTILRHSE